MKIKIYTTPMIPSKGITPLMIERQFVWRNTGHYDGEAEIGIADMQEPIWWNRPLHSDTLVKQEPDGLYSYNLPFIGGADVYKTGYNMLLPKNSIPIAGMIRINGKWTDAERNVLKTLMSKAVYNALIALGVDSKKLTVVHNDILFNGKKFMGTEEKAQGLWYSINTIITLQYAPEKEIFDRLTGEYAQARGITGIIEETNLFTKSEFMNMLVSKIQELLDPLP